MRISLSKTTSSTGGDHSQPLTSYYVKIDIGTPPKPFRMLVDVNARETWLPHYLKLGVLYARLNYLNGYAKKSSSTSVKEAEKEYTIDYNSCELTGKAYRDLFEFKDVVESLKVPKFVQRFLAISSASNDRFGRRGEVDGAMALNPWPISETGSDLISVTLSRTDLIGELIFGLSLEDNQNLDGKAIPGGELTLGGTNPNLYIGNFRYHTIWSQYTWELKLQSVMLGASVVSCGQGGTGDECTALISTSHNDIYGPSKDVQQILILLGFGEDIKSNGFKANKLYEIDCLKVASSPTLTFVIDGLYYVIPPTSYIRKKVEGLIFKSQTCYVSLLANEASKNQWILGTHFLSNFYTIFDISNRRIGFGTRK